MPFKKITNTHLKDKHSTTLEEYLRAFPGSQMTSETVLDAISRANKGKTYEEILGPEKATALKAQRSEKAKKQFQDLKQRELRRHKNWKGYKDISGDYWRVISTAAKKKGLGFDLTLDYIWDLYQEQNGLCKLSGLPLVLDTNLGEMNKCGYQRRTASLDRIDSTKGYVKGNVQWLHKDINQMKSNRTDQEFIQLCKAVALYASRVSL